jgi:hypothetical protein
MKRRYKLMGFKMAVKKTTIPSVFPVPYVDDFESGVSNWEGNAISAFQTSPWASNVLRLGYNQTSNWIYGVLYDFDIQIDYYERTGINPREITFAIQKLFESSTFNDAFTISYKKDSNAYIARSYINGVVDVSSIAIAPLRDGKFRITRVGDLFTSYYWTGSAWTQAKSSTLNNLSGEAVQIRLSDVGSINGDFDNFTVTSGTIVNRS